MPALLSSDLDGCDPHLFAAKRVPAWGCVLVWGLLLSGCDRPQPAAPKAPAVRAAHETSDVAITVPIADAEPESLKPFNDTISLDFTGGLVVEEETTNGPGGDEVDETDGEPRPVPPKLPEEQPAVAYEFREIHDPDGIGKFYMGREIAHVMGYVAANWLERPEREKEEGTSKLVKALDLKPGMVVGDIGAGSGVLTLPMAGRVGPKGKVIAVDVQQEMLDLLSVKLRARRIRNVELVLGNEKSPELPAESLDLALMVDVYHEFAYPYEMMRALSKAMKPGGRVVFVEFRMEDPKVFIKLVHKMTEEQVKLEIGQPEFRLKWKETIGTLPWQHLIVFEKQGADGDTTSVDPSPPKEARP